MDKRKHWLSGIWLAVFICSLVAMGFYWGRIDARIDCIIDKLQLVDSPTTSSKR